MNKVRATITDLLPLITESFENNQDITFKVMGTSMEPNLHHNQTMVTIKQFTTLKKNHIYLYHYDDIILLHRYIKTVNHIHYFKGDNVPLYEYVNEQDIIGEVIQINHKQFHVTPKYHISKLKQNIKAFLTKRVRG